MKAAVKKEKSHAGNKTRMGYDSNNIIDWERRICYPTMGLSVTFQKPGFSIKGCL